MFEVGSVRLSVLLLAFAVVTLTVGCTIPEPKAPRTMELDQIRPKAVLEEQKVVRSPGPPPFVEQLAPVEKSLPGEVRLYSLNVDNAALGTVLKSALSGSGLSLSIDAEVDLSRAVTVHTQNSTIEEMLDLVVVKGAGYAWEITEGQLEVNRFEERIYVLDYLNAPGETEVKVGGDMLASAVGTAGVAGKFQIESKRDDEKADIWAQITAVLEGIKSTDGTLQVNPHSGLIFMADTPRKVATMVRYLDAFKEALHRQVFIEAKIVDVQLDDSHRYGIDWSSMEVALNPSHFGGDPDFANLNFNRNGSIVLSEFTSISTILDFLDTQGNVTVLSNPHLSVMNGQPAVMTVGSQFPFSDITGVSRDEETNVVTIDATIRRVVFGLQLGITPQISADGVITLQVVPTVTRQEGTEAVEVPTSVTGVQTFDNPVIGLQELATTVRVRDGQAVVLAGLISQEKNQSNSGLPGLSKIPLLGYLFGNAAQETRSRELVILIRPFIKEVM